MGKSIQRALLCAALLVDAAHAADADPIHLTAPSELNLDFEGNELFFVAPGFTARNADVGIFFVQPPPGCDPCTPGQTFNPGFSTTNTFLGTGSAALGSSTFSNVSLFGDLAFAAIPVVFPTTSVGDVQIVTPFTFAGALRAFDGNRLVFSVQLVGSGTAVRAFDEFNGQFFAGESRQRYLFVTDAATATPEPASLLLLGTGVAALAVRRRRLAAGRYAPRR